MVEDLALSNTESGNFIIVHTSSGFGEIPPADKPPLFYGVRCFLADPTH